MSMTTQDIHERAAKNLKYAGCIDASDIEETVQILTAEYGPALAKAGMAEELAEALTKAIDGDSEFTMSDVRRASDLLTRYSAAATSEEKR